MKTTILVNYDISDDELAFIRQMGVEHIELNTDRIMDADELIGIRKRFGGYGITPMLLSCMPMQKNRLIDLGLDGRDGQIGEFKRFVREASKAGFDSVSVAWQPNNIHRSGRKAGEHTRGGVATYYDDADGSINEIKNERVYTVDEVWDAFGFFLEAVGPVMKECGVTMSLHPNDPPVEYVCGVGSLIYRSDDYRRILEMDRWDVCRIKYCIGCALEGGEAFGDVYRDLEEFISKGKINSVHFRNVSGTLPYFEETLAEDGYREMYPIMKHLVRCGYDGIISVDHVFGGIDTMGGRTGAFAYPTGYMKGLMKAAETEVALERMNKKTEA